MRFRPGGGTNGTFCPAPGVAESLAAAALGFSGTGAVCLGAFRASSLGRGPVGVPGKPLLGCSGLLTAAGWRAGSLQASSKKVARPKKPAVVNRNIFMSYQIGRVGSAATTRPPGQRLAVVGESFCFRGGQPGRRLSSAAATGLRTSSPNAINRSTPERGT